MSGLQPPLPSTMPKQMIGRPANPHAVMKDAVRQSASRRTNWLLLPLCFALATLYIGFFRGVFGIENFPDLQNYRNFFEGGYYIFILQRMSGLEYITSEATWSYFVDFFRLRNFEIYEILFISSVVSLGSALYYVYVNTRNPLNFLFFLNPLSMDLYVGQNRSALASGLFLLALTVRNPTLRLALMLFAGTFHISIFILTALYVLHWAYLKINEKFPNNIHRVRFFVLTILLVSVFSSFGRDITLYQLNDSRSNVLDGETSSWAYVAFWTTLVISYFALKKEDFTTIAPTMILFCFSNFILFTYTGNFSSRWAAYSIPFIAVVAGNIKGLGKEFFLVQYFIIASVAYVYWINQAQVL